MKTVNDKVIVKPKEAEKSKIIIPDAAKRPAREGEIVQIGIDVDQVKKGDNVLYSEYAGTLIKVGGVEYMVIREDDIIIIL